MDVLNSAFIKWPTGPYWALPTNTWDDLCTHLLIAMRPCVFGPKVEEDDEGFDLRILAVLALPLFGISWALFNVWRVAFRQVVRIGESAKGNPL